MQSLRRAAVRAARSSSMTVAVPRQQVAALAMQVSKANAQPATMLSLARSFSQTSRVAQDDNSFGNGFEKRDDDAGAFPPEENVPPSTTIFVSNVTFDATDVHLQEAFGKYGEIQLLKIARDARGLSRGFAFITFKEQEAADRAVQEASNSFWHGRRIYVNYRKASTGVNQVARGGSNEPTTSLYIGNIPYETSDADLNKIFRELDGIMDVRVAVDRNTGWPRGFAHADFADLESAKNAHEKLKETRIGDRLLRIDFAAHKNPRL